MLDPLSVPLLRLDPPLPVGEVKKPKTMKVTKHISARTQAAPSGQQADGGKAVPTLDDILGAILPPREVEENGQPMLQLVSAQPATRLDVIHLQEMLDNRLVHRLARETGICAVRSELYSEVFDELIRQVTINCPERGLLLLRVRDEIRMTRAAHKCLYETGVRFGVRKAAIAEQGLPEMRHTIRQLERDNAQLEARVQEMLQKIDKFEKGAQDERLGDEKRHGDEVAYYRKTTQQLSTHLKTETEKANSKK
jgi:dynein light intermediate chain